MIDDAPARRARLDELVTIHSVTWLVVANAVGLWLATLLLRPELGGLLGPFTYGRLMPLHLDLHLYGWCSLPLVGLLFRFYLPSPSPVSFGDRDPHPNPSPRGRGAKKEVLLPSPPGRGAGGEGLGSPEGRAEETRHAGDPLAERAAEAALGLWSAALAFGAVSWLAGETSGKLFLDWSGAARAVLAASMAALALALAFALGRRELSRPAFAVRAAVLVALAAVPAVLYASASPTVYPPINPDSGGATGTSLLGSSLGIVVLLVALPYLLGLSADGRRTTVAVVALLAVHFAVFALLGHGDRSHHEPAQVVGLASLIVWPILLTVHLRRFAWPAASRRWLYALGAWGTFLVVTGLADFLPGALDHLKFTNALVAHAHIAMAGLVTSLNAVVLISLSPAAASHPLAGRRSFLAWNAGSLVLVAALMALGIVEGLRPGVLFRGEAVVTALYGVRWAAGALMLAASAVWLGAALGVPVWKWSVRRSPAAGEAAARCAG